VEAAATPKGYAVVRRVRDWRSSKRSPRRSRTEPAPPSDADETATESEGGTDAVAQLATYLSASRSPRSRASV
jgi:hypothetical protein